MTNKFHYIYRLFTQGHERTLRAKKNILITFVTKILSIIISFIIVPLTLGYVGKVEYGIWMTIAAIVAWFNFFDIGLGNGLRNKLAEALALGDEKLANVYISSTFAIITIISGILFMLFFIIANFISWNRVLNTDLVANNELFTIVVVVFFFFCISFVLRVTTSVLQAMQRYAILDIIQLIAQFVGLVGIFILVKTTKSSLFYLCVVYGGQSAVVMLISTIILFNFSLKNYKPKLRFVKLKEAIPLFNLGAKFFMIQIFYMVVTQISVILVAQFFGPEDVTVYNMAVRYFSIISMGYIMVLTPFLSAFTEAYTKKEYSWIKNTIRKINLIWGVSAFGTLFLIFFSKIFFHFWLHDKVLIPFSLVVVIGILSLINNWGATFSLFMNGIGKINLQIPVLGIQAILFFPLTYLFVKVGIGLTAIVIPQIIFGIANGIIFTMQYHKIINNNAAGIWAK